MHIFSMTCKAESAIDRFGKKSERDRAIRWFRDHSITKLYIESYRHGRLVPEARLRAIRDDFVEAGFEVGGCITPTCLNERKGQTTNACFNDFVTCFSDPSAVETLQEIVELTARLFDFFILDDFMFTNCACARCKAAKGDMTWQDYRCDLMLRISKERVLTPARRVNPNVKVIIKYPLWYETYNAQGYDVIRETDLYDAIWIGTETRDPDSPEAGCRPQTAASWIQGWMNDIGSGKCGGGWYDPINTSPHTFLEQARQTIIGGAKESLLHCYDYLGTTTPGIALHDKDQEVQDGLADAEAFRQEAGDLQALAGMIGDMEPYGVLVPKAPNQIQEGNDEAYLSGFVGMLGIPSVASGSLSAYVAAFFGVQANGLDELADSIADACCKGTPLVVTQGLLDIMGEQGKDLPRPLAEAWKSRRSNRRAPEILHLTDTLSLLQCPKDLWELMTLDSAEIDTLRNRLLRPLELEFHAPAKVSLHLFRSGERRSEVIENFNDTSAEVQIRFGGFDRGDRMIKLSLPSSNRVSLCRNSQEGYTITLPARSLVVISSHD